MLRPTACFIPNSCVAAWPCRHFLQMGGFWGASQQHAAVTCRAPGSPCPSLPLRELPPSPGDRWVSLSCGFLTADFFGDRCCRYKQGVFKEVLCSAVGRVGGFVPTAVPLNSLILPFVKHTALPSFLLGLDLGTSQKKRQVQQGRLLYLKVSSCGTQVFEWSVLPLGDFSSSCFFVMGP